MKRQNKLKKKSFAPRTVKKHLGNDLSLDQDITVVFWRDPSRAIIFDLIEIMGIDDEVEELDEESKQEMDDRYWECASMIMVDCDIEGVDFSTPETTKAAFQDERLPWGIFYQALMVYVGQLLDDYQVLKNALRRVNELSSSSRESDNEEE